MTCAEKDQRQQWSFGRGESDAEGARPLIGDEGGGEGLEEGQPSVSDGGPSMRCTPAAGVEAVAREGVWSREKNRGRRSH
jgi:hypothetical protein